MFCLVGAHSECRIVLQMLDRLVSLTMRQRDVTDGYVHLQVDEGLSFGPTKWPSASQGDFVYHLKKRWYSSRLYVGESNAEWRIHDWQWFEPRPVYYGSTPAHCRRISTFAKIGELLMSASKQQERVPALISRNTARALLGCDSKSRRAVWMRCLS